MGWFGLVEQFLYVLGTMRADRDENGDFIITGDCPTVGIGGVEIAVPSGCQCLIAGKPQGVCPMLNSTSYGIRGVKVF